MLLYNIYVSAMLSSPTLKISQLEIGYANNSLFSNLNLEIKSGESLAILGCNGTGKSSLIKTIAGRIAPANGDISFSGGKLELSYLPQNSNANRNALIKVFEFVGFGALENKKLSKSQAKEKINEALAIVDLSECANKLIGEISGGQFVRAQIARLLVEDKPILAFDEPFASLDTDSRAIILDLMDKLKKQGKIIIVSIHDDALAQGFEHFLTLDGKNALWENNHPEHSVNCEFHHHVQHS